MFVALCHFHFSKVAGVGHYPSGAPYRGSTKGRLLELPANNRLADSNNHFDKELITNEKSFIVQAYALT